MFKIISTLIYALVGGAGYLMFGDSVMEEVRIIIINFANLDLKPSLRLVRTS
jgi:amino acid permease